MSKKHVVYEGIPALAQRVQFYVKRGAYNHGYVWGWQLVKQDDHDSILISGEPGRPLHSEEFQNARFKTLNALLETVADDNLFWGLDQTERT